jgi:hypothetical protein
MGCTHLLRFTLLRIHSLSSVSPFIRQFFSRLYLIQDLQDPGDIPKCLTDMSRIAIKAF